MQQGYGTVHQSNVTYIRRPCRHLYLPLQVTVVDPDSSLNIFMSHWRG